MFKTNVLRIQREVMVIKKNESVCDFWNKKYENFGTEIVINNTETFKNVQHYCTANKKKRLYMMNSAKT